MSKTKSELWRVVQASKFISSYLAALAWTEECREEFNFEFDVDDLTNDALSEIIRDCSNFLEMVEDEGINMVGAHYGAEQAGHDFWLTRNRHGAGFWDRGLGEVGDQLTRIAHSFGSVDVYRTDRGKIAIA